MSVLLSSLQGYIPVWDHFYLHLKEDDIAYMLWGTCHYDVIGIALDEKEMCSWKSLSDKVADVSKKCGLVHKTTKPEGRFLSGIRSALEMVTTVGHAYIRDLLHGQLNPKYLQAYFLHPGSIDPKSLEGSKTKAR